MAYLRVKGRGAGVHGADPDRSEREKFVTAEEVQRMLAAAKDAAVQYRRRDHAIVFFAFRLGLRISEITALEVRNFRNVRHGEIYVRRRKRRGPDGDKPVERLIPVVETVTQTYAQEYLKTLPKTALWLFPSALNARNHISESMVRRILNTYLKAAGLPVQVTPHALRHGRGAVIWEKTHDLMLVRDQLGHASTRMAEVYSHLSPKARERYKQILDSEDE